MDNFKRVKWLLKNLTFPQFIKYIFLPKEKIYLNVVKSYDILRYDLAEDDNYEKNATLLIKPTGIKNANLILNELSKIGYTVESAVKILDYRIYSRSVYYKVAEREQDTWFYIIEKYYGKFFNNAYLLYFKEDTDIIRDFKSRLRKRLGIDFYRIISDDKRYITSITPLHSSDSKERKFEEATINRMIKDGKAIKMNYNELQKEVLSLKVEEAQYC